MPEVGGCILCGDECKSKVVSCGSHISAISPEQSLEL